MESPLPTFTEEERRKIYDLPGSIVAASTTIEHDGEIGSTREIVAGLRAIIDGAELFLENDVIQAFFADYKIDGKGEERTMELSQNPTPALSAQAVGDAASVTDLLAKHVDVEQATQFREWMFSLADEVINSTASGGFLGIGGRRVSSSEQQFLDSLRSALALDLEGASNLPADLAAAHSNTVDDEPTI